ncbi:hypothetical protein D2962_09775 [Biomaibacter acetigenes]|jgi:hypothetical protein|uniref:Uncharacterized protein n=1 Tax=Biomaibacter acetigenes TaxID=2316383 RepID=A0A3G2R6Z5_9FIRM|nr:hypothetical protein [Biomaibacter acetigenes]AYO30868.1 hypothetical protein D2962_09775 [Biomaibacter acetigenes]
MVKPERTHERDVSLSERHRLYGIDCPAVDIDLLLIEYDQAAPVALIEYKNEHAYSGHTSWTTWHALETLANNAMLPLFQVIYSSDFSRWEVRPVNYIAQYRIPQPVEMDEPDFVRFLYSLRGREVPPEVLENLQKAKGGCQ